MEKLRKSGRARIAAVSAIALVGVFASLGATGYAARLVKFSSTSPNAAQYPPSKVTICHHTHSQKNPTVTITVSVHALPAHLKHGDTVGPCSPQAPSTPAEHGKLQKTKKAHPSKHSGAKGKSHGQGKPEKTTPAEKSHGQGNAAQANSAQANGKGHGQAKGHDPAKTHGQGKSHGQGKGHDSAKTHGQGKGHGQGGQGHGQGQGQGQGQGGTHGSNQGGKKDNGHKP
jgi:hypothetical protein